MDRLERSDRLDGEGLTSAVCDLGVESQHGPMIGEACEERTAVGCAGLGKPSGHDSPDEGSIALDERQIRGRDVVHASERFADIGRPRLRQEPRQRRARVRVDGQRSPLSLSMSA